MTKNIQCATCGRTHPVDESELTFNLPDEVFALSDEEREARCKVGSDIVRLDDDRFFVRGVLPLNVEGRERPYGLGVWAEISPSVFERLHDLWDDDHQDQEPRMPGKLANKVQTRQRAGQLSNKPFNPIARRHTPTRCIQQLPCYPSPVISEKTLGVSYDTGRARSDLPKQMGGSWLRLVLSYCFRAAWRRRSPGAPLGGGSTGRGDEWSRCIFPLEITDSVQVSQEELNNRSPLAGGLGWSDWLVRIGGASGGGLTIGVSAGAFVGGAITLTHVE